MTSINVVDTLKIEDEIMTFLRGKLEERKQKLTPPQRERLSLTFPRLETAEYLVHAIDVCDRTIRKNEKGRP